MEARRLLKCSQARKTVTACLHHECMLCTIMENFSGKKSDIVPTLRLYDGVIYCVYKVFLYMLALYLHHLRNVGNGCS